MPERIKFMRLVEILHSHIGLFVLLGGGAVISAALALAAWATAALRPLAPLSWAVAALGGAVLFAGLLWLISAGRALWVRTTINRSYYQKIGLTTR